MYSPSGCRCSEPPAGQVWYYHPVVYYQPQALYQALQFAQAVIAVSGVILAVGELVKALRGKKEQ